MSLTKSIFNKELYDLKVEDLKEFFATEQEETSIIEFKSGETSLAAIYQEVSAFLNTDGGLLIIGAPKETSISLPNGKKGKLCSGELTASQISSQDVLMRGIASHIAPSPSYIKPKTFEIKGGRVFVLEIPQSLTPPHQASDEGKYFIRLDRETRPAPHGFVEALFQKRQNPILECEIHVQTKHTHRNSFFVVFRFSNKTVFTAENLGYLINIDGIKNVKNHLNISDNFKLIDGDFSSQGIFNENYIVKGIYVDIEIEVDFIYDKILIDSTYYCKGCQSERMCGIFDLATFKFSREHNSRKLVTENSIEEIFDEYHAQRKVRIKNLLSNHLINELQFNQPVEIEKVKNLVSKISNDLPSTYIDFLEISNGFSSWKAGKKIQLFSIEKVSEHGFGIQGKVPYLIIGCINDSEIFAQFKDEKWEYFLMNGNYNLHIEDEELGNSFFEVLQFLTGNQF